MGTAAHTTLPWALAQPLLLASPPPLPQDSHLHPAGISSATLSAATVLPHPLHVTPSVPSDHCPALPAPWSPLSPLLQAACTVSAVVPEQVR